MAKIKKLVSFTDKQWDMLQKIMEQEGITAVSVALGYLISEETKRRNPLYLIDKVGEIKKL